MHVHCLQTDICACVGPRETLSVIPQEYHPACYLRQGLLLVSPAPNRLFICQYESIVLFVLSFAAYCGVGWRSSLCGQATVSLHRLCAGVSLSTVLGSPGTHELMVKTRDSVSCLTVGTALVVVSDITGAGIRG